MLIITGKQLYGRVDEVPGMFHIATQFFHVWYIPLIPLASVVVLGRNAKSGRVFKVGLSGKSIGMAWTQGVIYAVSTVLFGYGMSIVLEQAHRAGGTGRVVGGSVLMALGFALPFTVWAMKRARGFGRAKYEQAVAIAQRAGLGEEALIRIDALFGIISGEDAALLLENLPVMAVGAPEEATEA